jgi:hypothetical protein
MKAIEQQFASLAVQYALFTGQKSPSHLHLIKSLGNEFKRIKVNDSLILVFVEKYVNMKENYS